MDAIEKMMSVYGLSPLPLDTVEAMAYVPFQPMGAKTYSPIQGLEAGTMYPTLNKPFYGKKCFGDKS